MSIERLVHLHQCLCEIEGFNYALTGAAFFGNCCGILVSDLYHWPPVKAKPIYSKPHKKKMGKWCNIRPNTTQRRSVEKVPINYWQASVTLILLVFHRLDLAS